MSVKEATVSGKRFKLVPEMEGPVTRWYARQRGTVSQIEAWRTQGADSGSTPRRAWGPSRQGVEHDRFGHELARTGDYCSTKAPVIPFGTTDPSFL